MSVSVRDAGTRFGGPYVRWARVSEARAGCGFDENDPEHQVHDGLRYAQWIQTARDRKDYAAADQIRQEALRGGMQVEQDKASTRVLEVFWRSKPAWRRRAEAWALRALRALRVFRREGLA